jgi:hypothetical protein
VAGERVFSFDDGALTILAPPGALEPGAELVASARGPDDRPPELADIDFRGTFYRLEPDGLTFPEPITIIRRVALADLGVDEPDAPLPIITVALRTTDGSWSWLENQTLLSDGEYLYLSGEATHTSQVLGFGGSNNVTLAGWALEGDEVRSIDVLVDGVHVGRPFSGRWAVSAPLNASAPPTISPTNWSDVSPALRQHYEQQVFPAQFQVPSTGTGLLAEGAQISNSPDWPKLPTDQRGAAFPSVVQSFQCTEPGHFDTVTGFQVSGLGAGSQLWDRLNLDPPSTMVVLPVAGECVEPVDPGVEVGAFCLITVHTATGPFVSYMRGLVELIERLGWPVSGLEVTLSGANDGEPARAERRADNVWEFTSGLHNAGAKKVEKVLVHFTNGVTRDITQQVIQSLGGDSIDVPFPAEPTFGTCPAGAL